MCHYSAQTRSGRTNWLGLVSPLVIFILMVALRDGCKSEPEPAPIVRKPPPEGMTEMVAWEETDNTIGKIRFWMTKKDPLRTHDDKGRAFQYAPSRIDTMGAKKGRWYFLIPWFKNRKHGEIKDIYLGPYNPGFNWVWFIIDNATNQTVMVHYIKHGKEKVYTLPPYKMVLGSATCGNHLLRFLNTDGTQLEAAYIWIPPVYDGKKKTYATYVYNICGANSYEICSAYYTKSP